ncbi:hypothetical protein ACTFIV_000401 [Dictyostelium citrinum]
MCLYILKLLKVTPSKFSSVSIPSSLSITTLLNTQHLFTLLQEVIATLFNYMKMIIINDEKLIGRDLSLVHHHSHWIIPNWLFQRILDQLNRQRIHYNISMFITSACNYFIIPPDSEIRYSNQ